MATHPTHDYDGVHLNLDIIKQPPSLANPVHIPLNQWDGLFKELQGETEEIRQLQELLGLNILR